MVRPVLFKKGGASLDASQAAQDALIEANKSGQIVGTDTTHANLVANQAGDADGDKAFLSVDDIGTGTASNPQYPRGLYTWDNTAGDYTLALPMPLPFQEDEFNPSVAYKAGQIVNSAGASFKTELGAAPSATLPMDAIGTAMNEWRWIEGIAKVDEVPTGSANHPDTIVVIGAIYTIDGDFEYVQQTEGFPPAMDRERYVFAIADGDGVREDTLTVTKSGADGFWEIYENGVLVDDTQTGDAVTHTPSSGAVNVEYHRVIPTEDPETITAIVTQNAAVTAYPTNIILMVNLTTINGGSLVPQSTEIDLTALTSLATASLFSSLIENVTGIEDTVLSFLHLGGAMVSDPANVDAIINALSANAQAKGITNGTFIINGGNNAAPTSASATNLAWLQTNWTTVLTN